MYAFISDLHDQYETLDILPDSLKDYKVFVLGDICEEDPHKARKCIRALSEMEVAGVVLGVHDKAIFDEDALKYYINAAERGYKREQNLKNAGKAMDMRTRLGREYITWLSKWQEPVIYEDTSENGYRLVMVHDLISPLKEGESVAAGLKGGQKTRMIRPEHAKKNLALLEHKSVLVHGHTHSPVIWEKPEYDGLRVFTPESNEATLELGSNYIACPGSMNNESGHETEKFFPTDLFPGIDFPSVQGKRSNSYATFDSETGKFKVHFHIEEV